MTLSAAPGMLYVVGTPIGNLEDVTLRALRTLGEVDLIAAEDTRVTRKLLARYDIHTPVTSYHQNSPPSKLDSLLRRLRDGEKIAVVSDAGMPGISDPGAELIAACLEASIPVIAIPGPTAVMTALVVSGLPTEQFSFCGFLPSARTARRKALQELRERAETLVFYEAPHRIEACLADMRTILGDRRAAAARELSKVHEEVIRGRLSQLSAHFAQRRPRGELTVMIEGALAQAADAPDFDAALAQLQQLVSQGKSVRDAAREVSAATGLPRRRLYQAALGKRTKEPFP